MTAQALSQRLGNKRTVAFLKSCYTRIFQKRIGPLTTSLGHKGILSRFGKVLIEDSTSCELHEKLEGAYKGSGGSASKAGYKIHTLWNGTTSDVHSLRITPGNVPDQAEADYIVSELEKGDLTIRDLGYYSVPVFGDIHEKGAYFLSRFKFAVKVYNMDGTPIENLPKHIEKALGDRPIVELQVRIGAKDKFPVRLIGVFSDFRHLGHRAWV